MSGEFTLRKIRRQDVEEFKDWPIPGVRGVAFYLDGEVVGIAGLAYYRPFIMAFSNISEEMRPYLKTITAARGVKAVQKLLSECRAPVFAITDKDEPTSVALLERLGFEQSEEIEELYQWQH